MPLVQPENIRLPGPPKTPDRAPVTVRVINGDADAGGTFDEATGLTLTKQADGTVKVSMGRPKKPRKDAGMHGENIAEALTDEQLAQIAEIVLEGVAADIQSRQEWLATYEMGVDLLGSKLEMPGKSTVTTMSSAVEGTSSVKHPLLLEGTIRGQANAMPELLPAAGPCKVRDDRPQLPPELETEAPAPAPTDNLAEAQVRPELPEKYRDALADSFEKDMNHYLTTTASEYYPDTDRMLFYVYWGGCAFKKVYICPIRKRPISESVYAPDLIVSNEVTDLGNAIRVTHRIKMKKSRMRRLQLAGFYRDIDLGEPVDGNTDTRFDDKVAQNQGIDPRTRNQRDTQFTVYETCCELDLPGEFAHQVEGAPSGLPLPYIITIDRDSRKVISIRRNWNEGDEEYTQQPLYVKYGLVPALGFYDYGLVHIIGNQTLALTAIERQLIDAGQFENFPGFLIAKAGAKQQETTLRVAPGQGKQIETGGKPINNAVMPLPYKGPSAALAQFFEKIEQNARQLAGAAEIQVGEGTQNAPVGTVMALIDQATKIMSAIHKRLHQAQAQELRLLQKLLAKCPDALTRGNKQATRTWEAKEFQDMDLVPASDPNVPGQMHRYGQAVALIQVSTALPGALVPQKVAERVLRTIGISDYAELIAPPPQPGAGPPDPNVVRTQAQLQMKQAELQSRNQQIAVESADRAADRSSRERLAQLELIRERMKLNSNAFVHLNKMAQERYNTHFGAAHDQVMAGQDRAHDVLMTHTNAALQPPPPAPANGGPAP